MRGNAGSINNDACFDTCVPGQQSDGQQPATSWQTCECKVQTYTIWPKSRPEKMRPTRPKKWPSLAGAIHGPARVGLMDGGAFEVPMEMDGYRQLRNDWLLYVSR